MVLESACRMPLGTPWALNLLGRFQSKVRLTQVNSSKEGREKE